VSITAQGMPSPKPRRPSVAKAWLRALEMTSPISQNPTRIFPSILNDLGEKFADAPALLSDRETLTYRALTTRINQYARWAIAQNLHCGETVCLLMPNRPEYMAIWLGIVQVGGVVSLLNTNLSGRSLAHCINIVQPTHIIVDASLAHAFSTARKHIEGKPRLWSYGDKGEYPTIESATSKYPGDSLGKSERRSVTISDQALFIYTSGTTGFAKAAKVSHQRLMQWSHWFAGLLDIQPSDRMYDCLPLYHSIGGVVAMSAPLVNGGAVVIRDKFSAQSFWDDVVQWDCTMFQYIGEICRYLVLAPPHANETKHRLRLCTGNGLRPDVWKTFERRFQIPQILEYYAATEGNVSLFNVEGEPGAIGRIPPYIAHRFPIAIVKFDVETLEPVRDENGRCLSCAPNEVGEAIGQIPQDPTQLTARFEGYSSPEESAKKVMRDAFAQGDAWYRTGDLMRQDDRGFFFFVDRIGDTFRWKGENVATSEVAQMMTAFPGIAQANVYGVTIPGHDGRAGMAAVVLNGSLDLAGLRKHLAEQLPRYARPLFLRVRREMEATTTFKYTKAGLVREGYDPTATSDTIYFDDPESERYVPLDNELCERINTGRIRL
jgi:fatty-acyl-CoA synthase